MPNPCRMQNNVIQIDLTHSPEIPFRSMDDWLIWSVLTSKRWNEIKCLKLAQFHHFHGFHLNFSFSSLLFPRFVWVEDWWRGEWKKWILSCSKMPPVISHVRSQYQTDWNWAINVSLHYYLRTISQAKRSWEKRLRQGEEERPLIIGLLLHYIHRSSLGCCASTMPRPAISTLSLLNKLL